MLEEKLRALWAAVKSAAVAAAAAWGLREYYDLAARYPEVVNALAIVLAALWNRFRR